MNQKLSKQQALPKIKQYCAYQERCHSEVRQELFAYGLYPDEVEEIIVKLIAENYLNEQRFATAFASGRFRLKKWGKVKIKYELRKRKVSEACISKALSLLDEEDYMDTLKELYLFKEMAVLKEKNVFKRKMVIQAWLLYKGYERDLIIEVLTNGSQIENISDR